LKRIVNTLDKVNRRQRTGAVLLLCAAATIVLPAQTFTTLHSFDGSDGAWPGAPLTQATNGSLYGTTQEGGTHNDGTVFEISPGGAFKTVYSFLCLLSGCADGATPFAGLVQATNGDFYGTTEAAAASIDGTVFKITASGVLTTLYAFPCQSDCPDGAGPYAGLVQASNGYLYGTTGAGGTNSYGTVFRIAPSGALAKLYSFCAQSGCPDGGEPEGTLVQASNGDLYGTTLIGGDQNSGTVFKITPSGTLTTLYSFARKAVVPTAKPLTRVLSRALMGTCTGQRNSAETALVVIFKITPTGTLTTLHTFDTTDGWQPAAGLFQATNGDFYGTTYYSGVNNAGTVFSLSVGLAPFVMTRPASGETGAFVEILGSDLTGATSVTFNGTAATFTVVSRTLITTSVPAGATTGKIEVVTPGGRLSSNKSFVVP